MNNRILLKSIALIIGISALSACNSDNDKPKKDLDSDTRLAINAAVNSSNLLVNKELENKTIKFLSTWDINPDSSGKNVPVELAVFQEKYGGEIESKIVNWDERYEQLAYSINGGEGIDFFPAGELDCLPKGAIKDMFVPVDDYIDFNSPLWADVKDINDRFMWNDKHYIMCTEISSDCVMIYNRSYMDEYGFEQPYNLYKEGKWTWDALADMLEKFCNEDEQKYGLDGWYFEAAISKTTGVPYIDMNNGQIINNLRDSSIERVQNYMYSLNRSGCVMDKSKFEWQEHPEFIASGKELLYPCGLWTLYCEPAQWKERFGEDVFFVPMPRDPEADKYYMPASFNGYVMVKGGTNPEGVVRFVESKRFTLLDDTINKISNNQFKNDYGWSDELIAMKNEVEKATRENPVFDFYRGVSNDVELLIDSAEYGIRASMYGKPWSETLDTGYDTVNQLIDDALNDK